jgi:NADH-quinone oxidoreductase subunit F
MIQAYQDLRSRANEAWHAAEHPQRPLLRVPIATCSIPSGARELIDALRSEIRSQGVAADVETNGETGLCWLEPLVEVRKPDGSAVLYKNVGVDDAPKLVAEALGDGICWDLAFAVAAGDAIDGLQRLDDEPLWGIQERRLLARCGVINPESIDHYVATGGYSGLARALETPAEEIIQTLKDSTLRGRSGSNFPTGTKWEFLAGKTRGPKYLLNNADEGDPGAFVNRIIMECDPHATIEGMLIGSYVTGATQGFVYIRDEYPLAIERMERAVEQAYERGLLGENILGTGLSFELRVWRGAGSYVCGEESGLISSLDDSRGMPRVRPPYPADVGVFSLPSNVNNIETYASVALIMQRGLEYWNEQGTERNRGTKVFSFSGHIDETSVIEVPFGFPLRELYRILFTGPWQERRPLKAVQAGAALAGILPGHLALKLNLEPEEFREQGVIMGGGGIVFIDDRACIVDLNIMFSWFLEDESCGRCTTCHGGTQRMTEIFRRIARGQGRQSDYGKMGILGDMLQWSNCVHGSAAPTIMLKSAEYFREEIDEHINSRRCPAKVCPDLIRYEITAKSDKLPEAAEICPVGAIVRDEDAKRGATDGWYINERCIRCDACREIAPDAIEVLDADLPQLHIDAHIQDVGHDARGRMN